MGQPQPLDYRAEASTRGRSRIPLALLLLALTVIIYGLWKFEHAPYHHPQGPFLLLSESERGIVRRFNYFFAAGWGLTLVGLLLTFRRSKPTS